MKAGRVRVLSFQVADHTTKFRENNVRSGNLALLRTVSLQ